MAFVDTFPSTRRSFEDDLDALKGAQAAGSTYLSAALLSRFRAAYGVSYFESRFMLFEEGQRGLLFPFPQFALEPVPKQRSILKTVWTDVLARFVPLRRWIELFVNPATENSDLRDVYPPVDLSKGSAEFARVYVWATLVQSAHDAGYDRALDPFPEEGEKRDASREQTDDDLDWNPQAVRRRMLEPIFDLARFPLRANGPVGTTTLLTEAYHSNQRKVQAITQLQAYKEDRRVSASDWRRRKKTAPWWAVRALEERYKEMLYKPWLTLRDMEKQAPWLLGGASPPQEDDDDDDSDEADNMGYQFIKV